MALITDERFCHLAEARSNIAKAVISAVRDHDLTFVELASILSQEIIGWAKAEYEAER